jgi:hypothetical protein
VSLIFCYAKNVISVRPARLNGLPAQQERRRHTERSWLQQHRISEESGIWGASGLNQSPATASHSRELRRAWTPSTPSSSAAVSPFPQPRSPPPKPHPAHTFPRPLSLGPPAADSDALPQPYHLPRHSPMLRPIRVAPGGWW